MKFSLETLLLYDDVIDVNYTGNAAHVNSTDMSYSISNKELQCLSFDCVYAERHRQQYHNDLIMLTIILSIMGTIGAIGNIISIIVFSRTKIKSTSIYFILLLAITDLFVCIFVIPGFIIREWRFKFYIDAFCKIWELLRSASVPTSSMIMVAIAFDRFFIVFLNSKVKITKLKSRIIVSIIMITGLCLGIPSSLAMGVYYHQGQGRLVKGEYCMNNFINISYDFLKKFWNFITFIFTVMIILTFLLYSLIFITVYKKDIKRSKLRSNRINDISGVPYSKSGKTNENDTSMLKLSHMTTTYVTNSQEQSNSHNFENVNKNLNKMIEQHDPKYPQMKGTSSNEMKVESNLKSNDLVAEDIDEVSRSSNEMTDEQNLRSKDLFTENIDEVSRSSNEKEDEQNLRSTDLVADDIDEDCRSIISINDNSNIYSGENKPENVMKEIFNTVQHNQVEEKTGEKNKCQGQCQNFSMKVSNDFIITVNRSEADKKSNQQNDLNFKDNKQPIQKSSVERTDSKCYLVTNNPGMSKISPGAEVLLESIKKTENSIENIGRMTQKYNSKSHLQTEMRSAKGANQGSKSMKRKSIHWKTTQILFTVTIVYIASFLPVFLMSYHLIPQNKILYYMYFLNNVANPIIYSFMNKNFRDDVKKVFGKIRNS